MKLNYIEKVKEYVEEKDYKWLSICLVGSQNYNAHIENDTYSSDEDYVVLVLPTFMDLVSRKDYCVEEIHLDFGHILITDVRLYTKNLFKCNPHVLEVVSCEEDHYLLNKKIPDSLAIFSYLRKNVDSIINYNIEKFINSAAGMANHKKSLIKKNRKDNGKSLQHILRMQLLLEDVVENKVSFKVALKSREHELQKSYKQNPPKLKEALDLANIYDDNIMKIKEDALSLADFPDKEKALAFEKDVLESIHELVAEYIEKQLISEVLGRAKIQI